MGNEQNYFRKERLPYIWCPGCGNGTVLSCTAKAIATMEWDQNKIVAVSGIGCSSRSTGYLDFNTLHTLHGRALPFATGVKMANPELNVVVFTGDGDCTAIGGNHFIHAARRNIDLTVVLFNNNIYGMTGGQYSPTTPVGYRATTAQYGNIEPPFDIVNLALGAGATFVARTTVANPKELQSMIELGRRNKGFSLIEVVANCHEQFGRINDMKKPVEVIQWIRNQIVTLEDAKNLSAKELESKVVTGVFRNDTRPEYLETYDRTILSAAFKQQG
jgi:2-oxoglutarate ferredoxin oxidoreductase subunit beta